MMPDQVTLQVREGSRRDHRGKPQVFIARQFFPACVVIWFSWNQTCWNRFWTKLSKTIAHPTGPVLPTQGMPDTQADTTMFIYTFQELLNPHLSQMTVCFNKDVRYFRICLISYGGEDKQSFTKLRWTQLFKALHHKSREQTRSYFSDWKQLYVGDNNLATKTSIPEITK